MKRKYEYEDIYDFLDDHFYDYIQLNSFFLGDLKESGFYAFCTYDGKISKNKFKSYKFNPTIKRMMVDMADDTGVAVVSWMKEGKVFKFRMNSYEDLYATSDDAYGIHHWFVKTINGKFNVCNESGKLMLGDGIDSRLYASVYTIDEKATKSPKKESLVRIFVYEDEDGKIKMINDKNEVYGMSFDSYKDAHKFLSYAQLHSIYHKKGFCDYNEFAESCFNEIKGANKYSRNDEIDIDR